MPESPWFPTSLYKRCNDLKALTLHTERVIKTRQSYAVAKWPFIAYRKGREGEKGKYTGARKQAYI